MESHRVRDFDAKVVNNKSKGDCPPHVAPQFGRVLALIVSLGSKLLLQQIVHKNVGLWETVHPHPDLDVDPSAELGNVLQVIL
jgi:hypothetical protein